MIWRFFSGFFIAFPNTLFIVFASDLLEKEERVNIELRSEKVRNIIGNEMPFFIRYGISIITVILVIIAVCIWVLWKY